VTCIQQRKKKGGDIPSKLVCQEGVQTYRTGKEKKKKKNNQKTDLPIHAGRHRKVAFIRMVSEGSK